MLPCLKWVTGGYLGVNARKNVNTWSIAIAFNSYPQLLLSIIESVTAKGDEEGCIPIFTDIQRVPWWSWVFWCQRKSSQVHGSSGCSRSNPQAIPNLFRWNSSLPIGISSAETLLVLIYHDETEFHSNEGSTLGIRKVPGHYTPRLKAGESRLLTSLKNSMVTSDSHSLR